MNRMNMREELLMRKTALVSVCVVFAATSVWCGAMTVRPQDTGEALINPGMGLVHYHYSNRLWAYGMYSKPGDTDPLGPVAVVAR